MKIEKGKALRTDRCASPFILESANHYALLSGNGPTVHRRKDDDKIVKQINLDCRDPRPISNVCHVFDPPHFLFLRARQDFAARNRENTFR